VNLNNAKACGRHFTPEPNEIGYDKAVRQQAVELYVSMGRTANVPDATCG
jgi:hypothetical protein